MTPLTIDQLAALSVRDRNMLIRAEWKRWRYHHEKRAHRMRRRHNEARDRNERWRGECSCGQYGSWGSYERAADWAEAHAVAMGLVWDAELGWVEPAAALRSVRAA